MEESRPSTVRNLYISPERKASVQKFIRRSHVERSARKYLSHKTEDERVEVVSWILDLSDNDIEVIHGKVDSLGIVKAITEHHKINKIVNEILES